MTDFPRNLWNPELLTWFDERIAGATRVASLSEFDREVRRIQDSWSADQPEAPRVWYRGHSDAEWTLVPTSLREPFRGNVWERHPHMFIELQRRAVGLLPVTPSTAWSWLYLAQHFGFPTPLLDWTESSHVALFFALQRRPGLKRTKDAAVWLLNPGLLNSVGWGHSYVTQMQSDDDALEFLHPFLEGKAPTRLKADGSEEDLHPLAVIPEYITERLRGQRGAFVAFAWDSDALIRTMKSEPNLASPIVIPCVAATALERDLDDAGVTEATVFPDFGGLAAELARRHDQGGI